MKLFFRQSMTREGRNEQRKLRGALFNAFAITLIVTALVGPLINPALAPSLGVVERFAMGLGGWLLHLFARRVVRGMEDKP